MTGLTVGWKGLSMVEKPGMKRALRCEEEKSVQIVRKAVATVSVGVCEGTTGRVVARLPRVWAVADVRRAHRRQEESRPEEMPQPEVAFYRKYTEALMRRYLQMSTEAGRVPSLMGRELFRGQVTRYKVTSFEDVVIFCYDVEKCLRVLDGRERELIKRITLQAYSQGEAAAILGMSHRTCVRLYAQTLDKLTRVLLEAKLLTPQEGCQ